MLQELKTLISSVEVVSFDIFDTLLIRDVLEPRDIWRRVEVDYQHPGFYAKRQDAEETTYHNATLAGGEHRFVEIQNVMGEEWKEALCDELKLETLSLRANPEMVDVWNEARKMGKRRVLASDMYLSREFIAECLKSNGISGWDGFYVSSEVQCRKSTGELYKLMLKELAIEPSQMLHIGDNEVADCERPVGLGIRTYCYPNYRRAFFERFPFVNEYLQYKCELEAKRLLGALSCGWHIYAASQSETTYWEQLGFMLGGVLGYSFVKWIGLRARALGIKHLMFVGRDGYIWSRMANQMFPELKSDYFLAPRTISVQLQGVIGDCANAIKDRQRYIDEELGGVLNKEKVANDYAGYLEQFSIDAEKTALVDGISSAFSAQRMVEQVIGKPIHTFYLATDKTPYMGEAFFQSDKRSFAFQDLSEFIFGSPEPPVQYATKAGVTYSSNIDAYEKIKMDASIYMTRGALACAKTLDKANVLVTPQDWLEYYDAFMRNLTWEDCRHLAFAKNSTGVNHTNYYSILTHPRPKIAVKKSLFGFPILKTRYGWQEGAFSRTLLLLGHWKILSKKESIYKLAGIRRESGRITVS